MTIEQECRDAEEARLERWESVFVGRCYMCDGTGLVDDEPCDVCNKLKEEK